MQKMGVQQTMDVELKAEAIANSRPPKSAIEIPRPESDPLFPSLVEQMPAAVAIVDCQMRYLAVSRRWRMECELSDASAIGRSHYEIFPNLSDEWKTLYQHCLDSGETACKEDCIVRADGRVDWVKWEIQPWRNREGAVEGLILFLEVFTERKQLAEALQLTQFAMDKAADAVLWMTSDAKFSYVNEAACELLGYSQEELLSLAVADIDPAFSPPIWLEHWRAIQRFGTFRFESNFYTKQQEEVLVEIRVNYLKFNGEEYHCAFVRDIRDRKIAQAALQSANEQLQAVLDAVPGLVSWVSSDLRYLGVNRHLAKAFNIPVESFADREVGFLETSPKFAQMVQEFFDNPEKTSYSEVTININGNPRNYLIVAQKYHKGTKAVFVGIDISDRKQMEVALRRSETLYRTLAKNFPNGSVCLFDEELRHTLAEGTELSKIGLSNLEGKTLWEVFPPETANLCEPLYRAALAGKETVTEVPFANRLYLTHTLPLRNEIGEVLAGMVMTQNITERKKNEAILQRSKERFRQQAKQLKQALHELKQAEAQLIQTEKMSSLGQLVAGVAHEINNPVSFIYGNVTHARQYARDLLHLVDLYSQHYPEPHQEIQAYIDRIGLDFLSEDFPKLMSSMQVGSDRIRDVVLSLRNFSRLDQAQKKPVDIHEGIDSTLLILQNRLKAKAGRSSIEVIKEYADLPLIECYAGQLNQVFMNLLCNAIDAVELVGVEEKTVKNYVNSGRLQDAIKVRLYNNSKLPTNNSKPTPPLSPSIRIRTGIEGNCVAIRIGDNGIGMTEDVKKRLFDPFFTTKSTGKGTGLGLSIAYQIVVDKHGGNLECHSVLGEGTEFVITLPIIS